MPIYEYRCQACGGISEYLMGVGGGEPVRCKSCGGEEMHRILSVASVSKGSSGIMPGQTCCGREERCQVPPCSGGEGCRRD